MALGEYRLWHKEKKHFVEWDEHYYIDPSSGQAAYIGDTVDIKHFPKADVDPMMNSKIKDRNGRFIFEGDIVEVDLKKVRKLKMGYSDIYNDLYRVCYAMGHFRGEFFGKYQSGMVTAIDIYHYRNTLTVVGNIKEWKGIDREDE